MKRHLYEQFAATCQAWHYCKEHDNSFAESHEELLKYLTDNCMPHGSGIDAGMTLDIEKSGESRLVFEFSYHFMDEHGYYDGWGDYKLIVTASLVGGFNMRIVGWDRNDIKEYLYQTFDSALNQLIDVGYNKDTNKFFMVQS